ncbi:MAG: N-acetylglucosamine-specific PTS transporter subunit IIBC [Armatimonadota bacterium]
MNNKFLDILQRIGKALLVPIAVMPTAAILLRLGAPDVVAALHIKSKWLLVFFSAMNKAGGAIFDNLPLLFAVGIAIGLTESAGVAALASVVGYLVLTAVLNSMTPFLINIHLLDAGTKIDMGVFAGILVGVVVAVLYQKYKNIKLPDYLQFFGGRRFVPIISAVAVLFMGIALGFIWPPVQKVIAAGGDWMVKSGGLGVFIYGFLNRLLLPFGLHHILNSLVWFVIGSYKTASGVIVHGDLNRFFAGDKTAGTFMAGFYPVMMFGLPAACLAMIKMARPARKKIIASLLLSAALTSFITGVTEPIEFSFMFVAPLLYLVHAVLTGLSMVITDLLGIKYGFGFSAGLIDYILSFGIATKPLLLLVVGVGYGILYYFVFIFFISAFNLATPGREKDDAAAEIEQDVTLSDKAQNLLNALGGKDNIQDLDSCITRLRLKVKDESKVNDKALKNEGALGIVKLGGGALQVVMGTQAELICEEMKKTKKVPPAIKVYSPFTGEVINLEDVPDEVFSQKMMGEGAAVEPEEGKAIAPVSGQLIVMFPTGHAFGIRTKEGIEVLIHIGLNTVELQGEGFKALKKQDDTVSAGEVIVEFDMELCRKKDKSLISPVIVTNMDKVKAVKNTAQGAVKAGKDILFEAEV